MTLESFYKGKKVFISGHTGFKGSWLCEMLLYLGADVYGYSLAPESRHSLFDILNLDEKLHSTYGDVRDYGKLCEAYSNASPDVVLHLAAQPLVRESYLNPKYTYDTNVGGTVNILECLRENPGTISFLNVTTDKVYENNDLEDHAFSEDDKLDGYDPYSNSKSCSELVTHSYKKSFFGNTNVAISTARAGNVIGGGDFAKDRIIPDCVRATLDGKSIRVRNPFSIRPYQHVLEPLAAYLLIAMRQAQNKDISGYYNIGPNESDCIETRKLADTFVKYWGGNASWVNTSEENAPKEANYLKLDCSKARNTFGWTPVWNADTAIKRTVEWYRSWSEGLDMNAYTIQQINEFLDMFDKKL